MEISGKIIQVLPERGGVSQRSGNEWKVATYLLETIEQYPKKCAFEVFAGKFLGFLVHHRGISVDPAKTIAIATMKRPATVKELKSFLGRVSYIRRFVPGLVSVTSELSKLLKRGADFT